MAKKWTPSLKQLSAYDELLKRQNIARKRILRRRKIAEEQGGGRPLPDLVIPMKARRHRDVTKYKFDSYKEYREKMKLLSDLYGGKGSPDQQVYKNEYKRNILSIIKDWIDKYLAFPEKPNGRFGKYSEEQIYRANQVAEDGGKFLILYNDLISLSIGEFMAMYDTGYIPTLKVIYEEIQSSNVNLSKVDEFIDSFSDWRRQVREGNRITTAFDDRKKKITLYSKSIKNRSEEKESEMRSKGKRIKREQ